MKTKNIITILLATFTAGWLASAADEQTNATPAATDQTNQAAAPQTNEAAAVQSSADTGAPDESTPTNGLYLNFHNAPLSVVLNYLSAKAGLTIISDVSLSGKVTLVARHPLTTNEVVDLLNQELGKNNYAATLENKTLTIYDIATAKGNTPIVVGKSPNDIPINDKLVTEILPVHTLNPAQLIKDLEPLIPSRERDTVVANEAGNAVIMAAPQRDVRRLAEIIAALDSTAISDVEVFVLDYADAKAVASELKEIFQSADSEVTRANTRNNFRRGGGGGPFGGFGPFGGGGGGNNNTDDKNVQTHAVFVSDDQVNAVVASAPPDYMPWITNVIKALDQPSQEVTVVKVFKLLHADATEIANELATLFPSATSTDQNNRTAGFRFMPPFMQQATANSGQSDRMKRQSSVIAVADARTQKITVTASRDLMEQISEVISSLDEGTAGVAHVTAFSLDSADPSSVELTLQPLFAGANQRNTSTSQTTDALAARATGNVNNQQSSATSSTTTSGFGTGTTGLR
jgi:type II secretory pathway component GspD/PulD (secretin)